MPVEPSPSTSSASSAQRTVLVAEDDDVVRALVCAALTQAGFEVCAACDGISAGDLFAAEPSRFVLVLTDVIMPQAMGTELAVRVRILRPDVPVVFMSAFPGGAGIAPDPLPADEILL